MSVYKIGLGIVVFLLLLILPSSAYANGYWDCSSVYQCVWVEEHPYYTIMDSEPDWCGYVAGDRVFLHAVVYNNTLWYDQFYVINGTDYTSSGPSGSGWSGDWYVSSNCTLFSAP
jgi:hypothetical protein